MENFQKFVSVGYALASYFVERGDLKPGSEYTEDGVRILLGNDRKLLSCTGGRDCLELAMKYKLIDDPELIDKYLNG